MNRMIRRPKQNSVLAFGLVVCLFLLAGLFFDFYYDLNDDVLIKDIVSGAYSGTPDAHSIQMLYPVSLLISLFYRVLPMFPWQGIFLCACHGICFYLIAKRSLSFVEKQSSKAFLLLAEGLLILTLFLWELVLVQYTITSALLAACACFLVFTSEKKEGLADFLKEQAVPVILVILAFNIRSEMLLLMSPFIAFTGIVKWSGEKPIFAGENIKKYLGMAGLILLGMGLSFVIDILAYSGSDWKAFRDFFDARTKVYDYTWYPDYEDAEAFYHDIGVSPAQVTLIDNYNFGLDESIDADTLWSIADYMDQAGVKAPLASRLKTALVDYKWRTLHEQDAPYNFFGLAAYGMVAALAIICKDKSALWKLPLLVIFRTIPWMYVILANRVPARISHPLYYIELIILCAWMLSYGKRAFGIGLLAVYAVICLPAAWQNVEMEMARRTTINEVMEAFDDYAKQHPENYYYMDVYSTVEFSEKMFADVDNSQKNYDILGGWADRSPLQKASTDAFHKDRLSRAELLLQDKFYFVCEQGADTEFLKDFYSGHGMVVSAMETDRIETEYKTLVIYNVEITGNKIN